MNSQSEKDLSTKARPYVAALLAQMVKEPFKVGHAELIGRFNPELVGDTHGAFALYVECLTDTNRTLEAAVALKIVEASGEMEPAMQALGFVQAMFATAETLRQMRRGPLH